MKKKCLLVILGGLMMLSLGTAMADPDDGRADPDSRPHYDHHRKPPPKPYVIKERIAEQERAIATGIKNRTLTRNEAHTLRYNIAFIKTEFQRAQDNDEHLSMHERERLGQMLDRNERMIRKRDGVEIRRF